MSNSEDTPLLTHSRMRTAATCLRKHFLAYIRRFRSASAAKPLRIGSLFHRALQLRGEGASLEDICRRMRGFYESKLRENTVVWSSGQQSDWVIEGETLIAMYWGYDQRWTRMDEMIQVQANEKPFVLPLLNPATGRPSRTWRIAGVIDKLATLPSGQAAVIEHKTMGDDLAPESNYWKRLRIDAQISMYMYAARELGHNVETVLYDAIRKPLLRPTRVPRRDEDGHKIVIDTATGERVYNKNKKPRQSGDKNKGWVLQSRQEEPAEFSIRLCADLNERPDYYYARNEIPRRPEDLEEAQYEWWQTAHILHQCERHGRWPRNTAACIGFGTCAYFPLCTGGYDTRDPDPPEGFIKVDDPSPELRGAGRSS